MDNDFVKKNGKFTVLCLWDSFDMIFVCLIQNWQSILKFILMFRILKLLEFEIKLWLISQKYLFRLNSRLVIKSLNISWFLWTIKTILNQILINLKFWNFFLFITVYYKSFSWRKKTWKLICDINNFSKANEL